MHLWNNETTNGRSGRRDEEAEVSKIDIVPFEITMVVGGTLWPGDAQGLYEQGFEGEVLQQLCFYGTYS